MRDWDCLDDARARLDALNLFDGVYHATMAEVRGQRAGEKFLAALTLKDFDEIDDRDEPSGGPDATRRVRWTLTLSVRDEDPEARERALDRLYCAAANALDGVALAGLAVPGWTKLRKGKYHDPDPPEQRLEITGEFAYFLAAPDAHDGSD